MIIYLDMDDVVADWMDKAREVMNFTIHEKHGERIPQSEWDFLKRDYRFYLNLPVRRGAIQLVNWCLEFKENNPHICEDVRFLTALPHDYSMPYAAQDKVWWANRHFPGIPVFLGPFSHDKWRHCKPGDVLIDDRYSNCSEWRSAGGLAHEYYEWDECEMWLNEHLVDKNSNLVYNVNKMKKEATK